ncbi:unnamed protein product [Gongylonema pulchrum]|uniref:Importin N-terminal domain-containing protein n=1 Tax=Gongylonema pulchrum TaxID=637853 RepID=A0A183EN57_9BILA|nr:unnamed protein product [Gongylonema pulchrum]
MVPGSACGAFFVRSLCLVLLRRIIASKWDELWPSWTKENQQQFCEQILKSTTEEQTAVLRKRLTDVIAEVARCTLDSETGRQNWPGVIQFLVLCTSSESAVLRETGMILLENVPSIFGSDQDQYLAGIKEMFHSSLLFASEGSVRTAAVRAYVAFMCDNEEDTHVIRSLSDQIPAVIQVFFAPLRPPNEFYRTGGQLCSCYSPLFISGLSTCGSYGRRRRCSSAMPERPCNQHPKNTTAILE